MLMLSSSSVAGHVTNIMFMDGGDRRPISAANIPTLMKPSHMCARLFPVTVAMRPTIVYKMQMLRRHPPPSCIRCSLVFPVQAHGPNCRRTHAHPGPVSMNVGRRIKI